jgi:hypothetical protein
MRSRMIRPAPLPSWCRLPPAQSWESRSIVTGVWTNKFKDTLLPIPLRQRHRLDDSDFSTPKVKKKTPYHASRLVSFSSSLSPLWRSISLPKAAEECEQLHQAPSSPTPSIVKTTPSATHRKLLLVAAQEVLKHCLESFALTRITHIFVITTYPPAVICTISITSPSLTVAVSISRGSSAA